MEMSSTKQPGSSPVLQPFKFKFLVLPMAGFVDLGCGEWGLDLAIFHLPRQSCDTEHTLPFVSRRVITSATHYPINGHFEVCQAQEYLTTDRPVILPLAMWSTGSPIHVYRTHVYSRYSLAQCLLTFSSGQQHGY